MSPAGVWFSVSLSAEAHDKVEENVQAADETWTCVVPLAVTLEGSARNWEDPPSVFKTGDPS